MDAGDIFKSDARSRPKPFSFRPPKRNPLILWAVKLIIKGELRRKLKVVDVEIPDADLERLRSLKGKRCLILPTHSGGFEPYVIFYLSKLLKDDYNYMAAMEAFEQKPLLGALIQRMGVYSIIRGTADRPSLQMTKQLLVDAKRWLVVFPEGQTVWQNDTVIPFQEGVMQLAFKAYETVAGKDVDASLFCVPIAVKYVYMENMEAEIDASLERLESEVFPADHKIAPERYDRLREIGYAVLTANEAKHGVESDEALAFDERIQAMKERVVRAIEEQLDIMPRADATLLDRVRALFNAVDRIVMEEPEGTPYEQKLARERQQAMRDLYDDLWRVLQFVAIYGEYVRESITAERFLDALCLLEMEVFGERRMWGPRQARVRVGEPIDLKDRAEAYHADKRGTTHGVTVALESAAREMLTGLASDSFVRD